jgi:hypothetical protein
VKQTPQPPLGFIAVVSTAMATFLGAKSWSQYDREHSLERSYAVIDARITKVKTGRARWGGCSTRVWIEFQVPGRSETFHYREGWNVFAKSSAIGFRDTKDRDCIMSDWKLGDSIQVAYATSDPSINRPYYGTLSRGTAAEEWQYSAWLAAAFAGGSVICILGMSQRRRTKHAGKS